MRVLCFDPSGNFSANEGKGSSGWAYFEDGQLKDFGNIKAEKAESIERYWHEHARLIDRWMPNKIVCESYKLQPGKAMAQSHSSLETSQLIGYIRMTAWGHDYGEISFVLQDPACKTRVADPILERMGIIEKRGNRYYCQDKLTNDHQRDAIRHGVYWHKYGK